MHYCSLQWNSRGNKNYIKEWCFNAKKYIVAQFASITWTWHLSSCMVAYIFLLKKLISTLCDVSVSSNDNIYGIVNNIFVTLVQSMKANNLYMPPFITPPCRYRPLKHYSSFVWGRNRRFISITYFENCRHHDTKSLPIWPLLCFQWTQGMLQ